MPHSWVMFSPQARAPLSRQPGEADPQSLHLMANIQANVVAKHRRPPGVAGVPGDS